MVSRSRIDRLLYIYIRSLMSEKVSKVILDESVFVTLELTSRPSIRCYPNHQINVCVCVCV